VQEQLGEEEASAKASLLLGLAKVSLDHPGLAIVLLRGGLLAEAVQDARLLGTADGKPGAWVSKWNACQRVKC
jgi:hypothetical protein